MLLLGKIEAREHKHTHTYRKKCRKERVGPVVAANPDNLESNKEAEGGAQGTQGSSKNCTSRESVSPRSCLIRGFRDNLIPLLGGSIMWSPLLGGSMRVA